jgi:hypothetical protein
MSFTIRPSAESIDGALDSWQWIGIGKSKPILVTSFADVFFERDGEIWFLDTLEGTFKKSHDTREDLDAALLSDSGKDHFLFGGFVEKAVREGRILADGQCYDFKVHPKVGGAIEFENVEVQDFVVALHIRGQIHEQVRHLPAGTKISKVVVSNQEAKPWWKVW